MVTAALYGAVASSAFFLGVGIALVANPPRRLVAAIVAFGSGVLVSALTFELMEEAFTEGHPAVTIRAPNSSRRSHSPSRWLLLGQGANHPGLSVPRNLEHTVQIHNSASGGNGQIRCKYKTAYFLATLEQFVGLLPAPTRSSRDRARSV